MVTPLLDPAEEGGAPLGEAELLRLAEALVPVFAGGGAAIGSITKFWLLLGADFLATTTGVAAGAATCGGGAAPDSLSGFDACELATLLLNVICPLAIVPGEAAVLVLPDGPPLRGAVVTGRSMGLRPLRLAKISATLRRSAAF